MLIPTIHNTKTVTDMRENAVELLEISQKKGPLYLLHHSKPQGVLLSIKEFKNFFTQIEKLKEQVQALQAEQDLKKGDFQNYESFDHALTKAGIAREELT